MNKHISKNAFVKNTSGLAIELSNEVKELKKKGINVLDATVGMLIEDNEELSICPIVKNEYQKNIKLENFKYASINGGAEFNKNAIRWVLKNRFDMINSKYLLGSCATLGGTGALSMSFKNYIDNDGSIILPSIGWGNYKSIIKELNKNFVEYELFDNDYKLNIDSIKRVVTDIAKKEGRVTILFNDPCHNPTSYSMSKDEWRNLINFFNEINEQYPLTLILDIAYLDFVEKSRNYFSLLKEMDVNYLTLVAFSASKSFSFYGVRLGALIFIGKDKEELDTFISSSEAYARTIWSCPNGVAIATFNAVASNLSYTEELEKYYDLKTELIKSRYEYARSIFDKEFNCEPIPYHGGFFITYKVKNAFEIAKKLKEKNIYVLPMQGDLIRIALCSLIKQ